MKKLLALLMACATMTCAFASCGDDDTKGSESESESSVSESSDEETKTTTEEEAEEETTEEETTETDTAEDSDMTDEETTNTIEKTTYEFIEDADKTVFIGKWECEKLVVEGEEMTDLMGMPLYAVYQLEVKEDGTAVMGESLNELSDAEVSMIYEWGVISDNEMAIINEDGDTMIFELSGDYMIGTEEGYDEQIYFVNVDEFTPFDFEAFMAEFQEGLEDIEIDDDSLTDGESDESVAGIDETVDTVDEENAETSVAE
ncbi:MAG: hypothetical protein NC040_03285 [Muribaculaceae bacterium]|nr:hypothetical protein [Alistipes senegalensis]MCM1473056.1 hypothetical protein [Muribaculaceae bacterium]